MSDSPNKQIVVRYFENVDKRDIEALTAMFVEDCRIVRPELKEPIIGVENYKVGVRRVLGAFSDCHTTIMDLREEGDTVVCHLRHDAVFDGTWYSRLGEFQLSGKKASWQAVAIFKMRDGMIEQELVVRDELAIALDLGVVAAKAL